MESVIGYMASLLIGLVLGMVGGGGSILTVPVLVYLFHVEPSLATAYSLFIVGATSMVGGIRSISMHQVDFKTAAVFTVPSILAVYGTRRYLLPFIPDELFRIQNWVVSKDIFIMVLFAVIMLATSISMITNRRAHLQAQQPEKKFNFWLILIEALVVGVITGIVGAGGGFLIIPALVLLTGLPFKTAVGTSLFIIAINSLSGFLGDVLNYSMDWAFLMSITALAIVGIFIGNHFAHQISTIRLRKSFGWFVLVTGIYILLRETL